VDAGLRLQRTIKGLDPQVADGVTGGLLFAAVALIGRFASHPLGLVGVISGGLCVASVAWRRRRPALATVVALAAGQWSRFHANGVVTALVTTAIILDYYSLGRQAGASWWRSWEMLLVATAIPVIATGPGHWDGPTVASVWAFTVVLPFTAARVVDAKTRLTAQLGEVAALADAAQLRRREQVAAEERTRIAREVHDVLAHSLSVMVIQTTAARLAAKVDTEAARQAMVNVEACGREALGDLRRMVGVVRHDDREPLEKDLAQLSSLADTARSAGLHVVLLVRGQERWVPPAASLAVYRIVQEALTNCLKHSAPATESESVSVSISVTITDTEAHLSVVDDGHPQPNGITAKGSGHGLIGMRERALLCGGSFEAVPLPEGGFSVQATMPIGEEASV